MARAYGSSAQMLGMFETDYGTFAAGNFDRLPFVSSALGAEQPLLASDVLGNGRDPVAPTREVIDVAGEVVVKADLRNLGFWLKGLLGAPATTGEDDYAHEFVSGEETLPSISIEIGHPQVPIFFQYAGVMVNSLAITFAPSGQANVTAGLLAQSETKAGATGGGVPVGRVYTPFSQFQGSIKKDGTLLANVTSGSITYSNNAEGVRVIRDDGKIEGIDPAMASLTGNITTRFADTTLLDAAIDGDAIALEFAYTISATKSLVLTAHEVYLPRPRVPVNGPGGIEASFDWQAAQQSAGGVMFTATLKNDVESY